MPFGAVPGPALPAGDRTLVDVALRDLPARALHRQFRRPFGRVNAAFYEWASSPAVAEIVAPAITERVVAHLANQGSTRNLPVVDVGAGGGRIAASVAGSSGREVVAVEPSPGECAHLRRRATPGVRPIMGSAESLPLPSGSSAAVYSSCAVKHWRDLDTGLRECVRVAARGGLLATVEIDGSDRDELRAFVHRTRIPDVFSAIYVGTIGRGFAELEPSAADVAAVLVSLGATHVTHERIPGLPFWIVAANAPEELA